MEETNRYKRVGFRGQSVDVPHVYGYVCRSIHIISDTEIPLNLRLTYELINIYLYQPLNLTSAKVNVYI